MSGQVIINPLTGRKIKINGPTHKKLISQSINMITTDIGVTAVNGKTPSEQAKLKIPINKKKSPVEQAKLKIPITKKKFPVGQVKLKIPITKKKSPIEQAKLPVPIKQTQPTEKILKGAYKKGRVFIGQKRKRGIKGDKDATMPGYKNIDVTSGSFNKIGQHAATTLSPMKLGPVTDSDGETALIFENYWQFSRLYEKAGHVKAGSSCEPTPAWFAFRKKGFQLNKGKRRPFPKNYGYGKPKCSIYNQTAYDYITSRKEIYIPTYKKLIENLPIISEMKKLVDSGQNLMIIDGDGPDKTIYPNGLEMTQKNWDLMIEDPTYSFGHGYVVAALVNGLPI
jgi:hypothetical protein